MNLNQKQFDEIVEKRLTACVDTLVVKAKGYIDNPQERLYNFHEVARRKGQTTLEALDGMFQKHYQSYEDMIKHVKAGKPIDQKRVDEKFTDLINYLLLAEGVIAEHNLNLKPHE